MQSITEIVWDKRKRNIFLIAATALVLALLSAGYIYAQSHPSGINTHRLTTSTLTETDGPTTINVYFGLWRHYKDSDQEFKLVADDEQLGSLFNVGSDGLPSFTVSNRHVRRSADFVIDPIADDTVHPGGKRTITLKTVCITNGCPYGGYTIGIAVRDVGTPTAAASAPATAVPEQVITLDSSGSSDPAGWPLTATWEKTSGTTESLSGNTYTVPSGTAHGSVLTFQLTVKNEHDKSDSDSVSVTVQRDPTAHAAISFPNAPPYYTGDDVCVSGSQSASPVPIKSYSWEETESAILSDEDILGADTSEACFRSADSGNVKMQLTVTTDLGDTDTATVTVPITADVDNTPPTVTLPPDRTVTGGDSVSITATFSDLETADSDLLFGWHLERSDGHTLPAAGLHTGTITFTAPQTDVVITAQFWVEDNGYGRDLPRHSEASMTITVQQAAPEPPPTPVSAPPVYPTPRPTPPPPIVEGGAVIASEDDGLQAWADILGAQLESMYGGLARIEVEMENGKVIITITPR